MEVARMNYYFTGILIILLTLLAFCVGPAYPKNEYLNSYPNECRTGEIDLSIVLWVKDIYEFYKFWDEALDRFEDYFARTIISVYVQCFEYKKSFLIPEVKDISNRLLYN